MFQNPGLIGLCIISERVYLILVLVPRRIETGESRITCQIGGKQSRVTKNFLSVLQWCASRSLMLIRWVAPDIQVWLVTILYVCY